MLVDAIANSVGVDRLHDKQLLEILIVLANLEPICQVNKAC